MSTFATVIVTKGNQAFAQDLTSVKQFTTKLKKGLRTYYISSGYFSQEHYDALLDSGLTYAFVTDTTVRPTQTIKTLGMTIVDSED